MIGMFFRFGSGVPAVPPGPTSGAVAPSKDTTAFTRFGRSFATSHPKEPPAECVMMIDGPTRSMSSAPYCFHSVCASWPSRGAELAAATS